MKTVNNIFQEITTKENLLIAIHKAAKRKRKKRIVKWVLAHDEEIAEKIANELRSGTWRPNPIHRIKVINDGIQQKKREIVCPDFINEQIVHHAILNVCAPIFQRRFYRYSCASVPDRGTEYAIKYIRKSLHDKKNTKYFSVMDIKQFFNTIRPSKVFKAIRHIIRDKRVLILFARILRANKIIRSDGEIIKRGTPIGFFTSPWFANILLNQIDHKIKANGIKYYIRYNDDMLLFSSNKRKLKRTVDMVVASINELGLRIKRPPQIHMLSKTRLNYIGASVSYEKMVLQSKTFLKTKRVAKRIGKKARPTTYDAQRIVSYAGRFKHYDTYEAYKRHIESHVALRHMKKIISKGAKRKNVQRELFQGNATCSRKCRQRPLHHSP